MPFAREVSVVAARGRDGSFAAYDVCENEHENHILSLTRAPARIAPPTAASAVAMTQKIVDALGYVGVITVEMFVVEEGGQRETLVVNEIAPRVHNSGHWTIDGAVTSQFEQHVRAICGWPLGSTAAARRDRDAQPHRRGRQPLAGHSGRKRGFAAPLRQARGPPGPQDGSRHPHRRPVAPLDRVGGFWYSRPRTELPLYQRFSRYSLELAHSSGLPPGKRNRQDPRVQVLVRDNNVDQALKALKKKMQREGIFREMKLRGHYEKPSEKRAREQAEAVRRARKLARKKMQREGLLPMKPRPVAGAR